MHAAQPFDPRQVRPVAKSAPLDIVVVVSAADALSGPERRVLNVLIQDKRFHLIGVVERQESQALPTWADQLIRLEAAVIPAPNRLPAPDVTPGSFALLSLGDIPAVDLVIDLDASYPDPALVACAKHGVWTSGDAFASAFQSSFSGHHTTRAEIICHTQTRSTVVAITAFDTKTLASHNLLYVAEKTVQLLVHELSKLHLNGEQSFTTPPKAIHPPHPLRSVPYVGRIARDFAARLWVNGAERLGFAPQNFGLRFGQGDITDFDPTASHPVAMPKHRIWADPFLISVQDTTYCFFEDMSPKEGRGFISVGEVKDGGLVNVQTALKLPAHMSYPFVFAHGDDVLMMPEVHEAQRLEIWRATDFPTQWERYSHAFDGTSVVDSTLLQHQGDWWLFTHISNDQFQDYCNELHVFKVDGPALTRIEPHRLNPVVVGAETARGGGRIVSKNGVIYRPSQDNSGGSYGYGLNIMAIKKLDLDHYDEERVKHVTPDFAPGLIGCHHFDATDGMFVIDVRFA